MSERNQDMPAGGVEAVAEATAVAETEHEQPRYMVIWGTLAVLTAIEVGVAFLGFSRTVTVLALLGMAVWKALLVAFYFMHLKYEPKALRIIVAAPLIPAALLVLVVLLEY
ncbi:MAG: cytochrome C oxidase subunit IV family protein [Gemmatimonadetes bacterium]|nr:cytochrome C oxidase subunit IV family protein [Gemmatimonadota bacterium]